MSNAPRLNATKGDKQKVAAKTHEDAKQWFIDNGVSIASWARENKFSEALVYAVLRGRSPMRGMSHNIAVKLGIKKGAIQGGQK